MHSPHPHRAVPVAHRRGPGARPVVALRDRLAPAAARRCCARTASSTGRSPRSPWSWSTGRILTRPVDNRRSGPGPRPARRKVPLDGCLLLGARHDRQHADGRRQPCSARTRTCASSASWRARTRPARSRTASPCEMIAEAEADGTLTPGQDDHRAVVGQHRHRPGHDRPAQGLPDQDRPARERLDRAAPAARGLRRRDHPVAGRRGLQRRRRAGRRRWPRSTPTGPSSTSTPTRPTPGPTTRPPVPRSGATAPRSPTSSPASARAARSWASARSSRSRTPTIKVFAVEPPIGEKVEGLRNLDEGYIPPVYEKWGGPSCSTASASCGPRSRSSGPGAWPSSAASSPASRPVRRWPAPPRSPSEIESGTIVFIVCDGGWKYLSTGAWTDDLDEVVAARREDHLLLGPDGSPCAVSGTR